MEKNNFYYDTAYLNPKGLALFIRSLGYASLPHSQSKHASV
jgi:hypothetical protein